MHSLQFIETELQRIEFERKVLDKHELELLRAKADLYAVSMTQAEWADLEQLDGRGNKWED